MKSISFVVGRDYQENKIFDLSNEILNRDNCLYPYYLLKEELKNIGISISTSDLLDPKEADAVIYNEMPNPLPEWTHPKSYLLLFETELIRPDNWHLQSHAHFKKIFTWNDDFVDGKKYIKFNFPNSIKTIEPGVAERRHLLTLISANKTVSHLKELYSERLKTITWFEKNHPQEFHYYGIGWDYSFNVRWQKLFNKLHILSFFPKKKTACYKGKVKEKNATLKKYKFAVCYENAQKINGYITEKIFDCFFAGCIPVYWGANNVESFIPKDCFIDRRDFKGHEDLYQYLINMNDAELIRRQKKINDFLESDQALAFSDSYFAKNIIENIIHE